MNIITKLRIISRILDTWSNVEKLLKENKMKLSVNAVVQILMLALQGLNQISDLLPVKAKFWAMIAISAIQGVVAVLAHFANPDGTPAFMPYVK
jgi:hypothetical protein